MKIAFLLVLTVGSWASWGAIVSLTSPASVLNQLAFLVSLVLAWWGIFALVAYGMSFTFFLQRRYRGSLPLSLRQGLPPALVLGALVWLQSLRALSPAMTIVLVAVVMIAEFLLWPRGARVP